MSQSATPKINRTTRTTEVPRGVGVHRPCSALVDLLPDALQTPIRDGGVLSIDGGPMMSFDEARTFAKARGFRSYLDLLDWLVENYGVPFKGEVVWPNESSFATGGANQH